MSVSMSVSVCTSPSDQNKPLEGCEQLLLRLVPSRLTFPIWKYHPIGDAFECRGANTCNSKQQQAIVLVLSTHTHSLSRPHLNFTQLSSRTRLGLREDGVETCSATNTTLECCRNTGAVVHVFPSGRCCSQQQQDPRLNRKGSALL